MKNFQWKSVAYFTLVVTTGSLTSCALMRKRPNVEPPSTAAVATAPVTPAVPLPAETAEQDSTPTPQDYKKLRGQVIQLNARLATLENRLGSVTESLNSTRSQVENWVANQKAKPTPVVSHSAEHGGARAEAAPVSNDPLAGFLDDAATRSYRKSMLLFKAERYHEAAISFGDFLEKFPDHPLAGTAQFYVGKAHFVQGDLKQALLEFQRVLTSYDRSAYVAQTLREMAEAEDRLQKGEEAARHRQLLTSLFPHSPFALTQTETHAPSKLDEPPLTEPLRAHEPDSEKPTP